jgi:hypothetical protein
MLNKQTLKLKKFASQHDIYKTICVISFSLFVVSLGFRLYFANKLAVKNNELKQAFDKKTLLEKDIAALSYEDAGLASLKQLEQRAKDLGFVEMNADLLTLNPDSPTQVASLSQR